MKDKLSWEDVAFEKTLAKVSKMIPYNLYIIPIRGYTQIN